MPSREATSVTVRLPTVSPFKAVGLRRVDINARYVSFSTVFPQNGRRLGAEADADYFLFQCLQGYEYPFEDPSTYYDGQLVEAEFLSLVNNNKTRYDMLKCRLAKGSAITSSFLLVLIIAATSLLVGGVSI